MSKATKTVEAAKFVGLMYGQRAVLFYSARVRGDLFGRLISPDDHTDAYTIYEQMRAIGPMVKTRLGNYSTTSYRISNEVLRSRNFGVTPNDGSATWPITTPWTCRSCSSTLQTTHDCVAWRRQPSRRAGWRAIPPWSRGRSIACLTVPPRTASST